MSIFGSRLRNRKFRKRNRLFIGDIREAVRFPIYKLFMCIVLCSARGHNNIFCSCTRTNKCVARRADGKGTDVIIVFFFFMCRMINAYLHLSFRLHVLCINTIIMFYEFFVDISLTNDIRYIMIIIIWSFYNISSPFVIICGICGILYTSIETKLRLNSRNQYI